MLAHARRHLYEIVLVAIVVLATALCFRTQPLGCHYCDTQTYLDMGQAYAAQGGVAEMPATELDGKPFEISKLRTYGYPMFVAGLLGIEKITHIPVLYLVYLAQLAGFLAASGWLAWLFSRHGSPRLGRLVLAALLLNVFIYPYLNLPLSDTLSFILEIVLFCLLGSLFYTPATGRAALRLGLPMGLVLGYMLMVRPGNLYLLVFAGISWLAILFYRRSARPLLWTLPAIALGFAAAIAPQLAFNLHHYHKFTFLPVGALGGFQIDAGRILLKYSTWTHNGGEGLYYLNPWRGLQDNTDLSWYFDHPWDGLRTIFLHIFGMLDVNFYLPYLTEPKPHHRWLLLILSSGLVYWAVWGWFRALCRWRTLYLAGEKQPALLFLLGTSALLAVSWLGIYALTAGENRFALPVLLLAGPYAAWGLTRRPDWRQGAALAGFLLYLALAWYLDGFLAQQMIQKTW